MDNLLVAFLIKIYIKTIVVVVVGVVDKVDNQPIECMVCASCTFKGEKRQEERKIDRSEGEAGGRSQGDVEEEKIELSKNCQNGFRKNSRDAAQMDDAAARRCSREFYRELRRQR